MNDTPDKNCVTLADGSCISLQDCMHGPGALSYVTLKDLLLEIERRGIATQEEGWYPTIGNDMAMGARNLLDMLPGSLLNATRERSSLDDG